MYLSHAERALYHLSYTPTSPKTQTAGFEPAHAEHTRLAGEPRNHLGTTSAGGGAKHATAGNRTRVETLGGFHHATRPRLRWQKTRRARGHAGARTQDLRLIRATLYRLSYTTAASAAAVVFFGHHGHLAQWQSTGPVNLGSRVRSSQWPFGPQDA